MVFVLPFHISFASCFKCVFGLVGFRYLVHFVNTERDSLNSNANLSQSWTDLCAKSIAVHCKKGRRIAEPNEFGLYSIVVHLCLLLGSGNGPGGVRV